MKKATLTLLLLMAIMAAGAQTALAQSAGTDLQPGWYAGIGGGASFGQATFRSITESKTHIGAQAGVFGGYQLSRLFSVEAVATTGGQTQTSLDCCPYWLSTDGQRSFAPVIDREGHYYRDLEAKTSWRRLAVQANFDVLPLLTQAAREWAVTLSPQVSAVTTRTRHLAEGYEQQFDRQRHLGLGGQAAVGYRVTDRIGLHLYAGITCLTGDRFDNIPKHIHKSNLIYEAGLKVSCHFVKKGRAASAAEGPAVLVEPEPQPVVESTPAVEETPAPAADTAAVVEKKPEAPEAAPAKLPVIYFANESSGLTADEAAKLDAVVRLMQEQPEVTLSIVGYASNIGSDYYNRRLSQRRADTVKDWLVQQGVSAARLRPVEGRGIDRNAVSHLRACRVELIINDKEQPGTI